MIKKNLDCYSCFVGNNVTEMTGEKRKCLDLEISPQLLGTTKKWRILQYLCSKCKKEMRERGRLQWALRATRYAFAEGREKQE